MNLPKQVAEILKASQSATALWRAPAAVLPSLKTFSRWNLIAFRVSTMAPGPAHHFVP